MGTFISPSELHVGDVFRIAGRKSVIRVCGIQHVTIGDLYVVITYDRGSANLLARLNVERLEVFNDGDVLDLLDMFAATGEDGETLCFTKFDGRLYT